MAEFAVTSGAPSLRGDDAGEPADVPVVLLHGLTATRRYVVMGSRSLERGGHRVVAYDARGHGASDPAPSAEAYTYADLADDLGRVLDDRGIERAVLAGASMGAHTLLRYTLAHPDRVAAVAVVTPAFDPEDERAETLQRWDRLSEGLRFGGVDGFVDAYGRPPVPDRWQETVQRVLRQRLGAHEHPDAVADALHHVPRSRPFGAWEDLGAIAVPAVVVASRDDADPEHPYALGECYRDAIGGAEFATEEEGDSPLAWQGARLSAVIAGLAARADAPLS